LFPLSSGCIAGNGAAIAEIAHKYFVDQHIGGLDPDPHHPRQHQHHRVGPFSRRLGEPFDPRLFDDLHLLAYQPQPRHVAPHLGERVRRQRYSFRATQSLETLASLYQLHIEVADTKANERRFHPADQRRGFLAQPLMLTIGTARIFLRS